MAKPYGVTAVRSIHETGAQHEWEETLRAHLAAASDNSGGSISLVHAVALFLEDLLHAGYSLGTIRRWWYYYKIFLDWCASQEVTHLEQASSKVLRHFFAYLKRQRNLGVRSLNGYFARLFFFMRHFTEKSILPGNPMQDMRVSSQPGKPVQMLLSGPELRSLFCAVEKRLEGLPISQAGLRFITLRDRVILELMLATGLRVSEVSAARVCDVDLERYILHISGKGSHRFFKRNRDVFLDVEPLRSHLEEYLTIRAGNPDAPLFPSRLDGGVLVPASFDVLIKRWAKRAGIDRTLHCHMFRHTFCTHLISHGADVFTVQRLMGHWAVETTLEYYLHLTPNELRNDWRQHSPLVQREG